MSFFVSLSPFLQDLANRLNSDSQCPSSLNSAAAFRAAYYQPTFSKFNNTVVAGAQWIHDLRRCHQHPDLTSAHTSIFLDGTRILCAVRELSTPLSSFQWDGSWFGHPGTELIDQYAGTPLYRELIDEGRGADEIASEFTSDENFFRGMREKFLLY
jgi:uncharacterized protein YbbC (DUF1343 family)